MTMFVKCVIFFFIAHYANSIHIEECLTITTSNGGHFRVNATILRNVSTHLDAIGDGAFLPEAPIDKPELDITHRSLNWKQSFDYLAYLLLKIKFVRVSNSSTLHAFINLTNTVNIRRGTGFFAFTCITLDETSREVSGELWTLGRDTVLNVHEGAITSKSISKYGRVSFRRGGIEKEEERIRVHDCICYTNYTLGLEPGRNGSSKIIKISRTKTNYYTRMTVELLRYTNNSEVEKPINTTRFSRAFDKNMSQIIVEANDLRPGTYTVRVTPRCQNPDRLHVDCGIQQATRLKWNGNFVVKSAAQKTGAVHIIANSPTSVQNTRGKAELTPIFLLVLFAGISAILIFSGIIAFAVKVFYPRKLGMIPGQPYRRLIGTRLKHWQVPKIAIVFCPDPNSYEHKGRVLFLKHFLQKQRFHVQEFGDNYSSDMHTNWIDLAESVVHNYDVVLIVISPLLSEQCSKCETRTFRTEDATGVGKLEGENIHGNKVNRGKHEIQVEIEEEDDTLHEVETDPTIYPHRLPAVVIDSLKGINACKMKTRPVVIPIRFLGRKEKPDAKANQLQKDHPSIFQEKAITLVFDGVNVIKNKSELEHLHRKLKY